MNIDVLQFLTLPDQKQQVYPARQTSALGSAMDIITPIDSSGYGQWKHIKNPQGWPWDIKLYDEKYVYDWITEGPHGWSPLSTVGPKSFKKFIQNHVNKDNKMVDGLPMFPRYVDTVDTRFDMSFGADRTHYATFENCAQVGATASLGAVRQVLRGPFALNHAGDVKTAPTLIHQYYWNNNGVPTLEENYYALNWGWVRWTHQEFDKKTGFYQMVNETLDIYYFRMDAVKIVFDCF